MTSHETYLLNRAKLADSHTLEVARADGAYGALRKVFETSMSPEDVVEEVKKSGLRGRGGAGFPTGLKWSFMPNHESDSRTRYMAVNADESEPGTCKDRVLLREDPHCLIEGCLIAAFAMRLDAVYVYVRGEYRLPYDRMQAALDEARAAGILGDNILGSGFSCEIHMHKGAGAYICGEETGLMESLEGKRGHPRPKPPFPASFGLWGQPTTVNNVESIFNVPFILDRGADWFRTLGTESSPGNFLCGISGHVERPGVYEVPLGISARAIVEDLAGGIWKGRSLKAWFPGGSSTGVLPADMLDTPMDHDSVKAAGSMFGTGAMIILDETASVVRSALVLARFYEHESCGQCSQCREGTEWLEQIVDRMLSGQGKAGDVQLLTDLSNGMTPGKTICALSDAAAIPMLAAIKHFRSEFEACIPTTAEALV
ncbi:MAG TPA: NADH-quinone oxidoreductase subunit NuoF [Planctomycetes bacterium]|nr:NADH-quinone oxidoreductase subunit NuoF [Planctomycetota bacterium]HIK61660.1 NADH oxidoreductase (quinone) subunit F [Planctomycetota bacterium]